MKDWRSGEGRSPDNRHPYAAEETLVDMGSSDTVVVRVGASVGERGASRLEVSLATDVGRVRHNNEDFVAAERVAATDGRLFGLWLVADGVGGGPRGERASRTAVETVIDHMANSEWSDPAGALTDAFGLANRSVYDISGDGATATTLVAALVSETDGGAFIANVGDSRAYLISDGEARAVTEDHSIVAARVAAGQITAEQARTAPGRNVVTRSIGSEKEVLVDVFGPRPLLAGQRLVLCTDGVHGMLDDATFARIASTTAVGEAAGALVTAAVEAGGRDNATALVGACVALDAGRDPAPKPIRAGAVRRSGRGPSPRAIVGVVVVLGLALLAVLVLSVLRPGL
jgi:PPM family protein phosphatase